MRRVTLNGTSYAMPYLDLLPGHSQDELNGLEASIIQYGVLEPIAVCISPTHGRIVIDGATRGQFAEKHELTAPVRDYGEMTDDESRSLAQTLNADRRHLSPTEYLKVRVQLIAKIATLRAGGKSVRAIAEETELPRSVVHRNIKKLAGVPRGTSNDDDSENDDDSDLEPVQPARVTGRDGKSYLATKAPVVTAQITPSMSREAAQALLDKARKTAAILASCLDELFQGPLGNRVKREMSKAGWPISAAKWEKLPEVLSTVV